MNELYHHGILGMKWGIRRYQNKDGSLTPAGKRRYAKLSSELSKLSGSPTTSKKVSSKPKQISQMSNEELQKKLDRLTLEKKYAEAVAGASEAKRSRAKKIVSDAGKYAVKKIFDTAVQKYFDNKNKEKEERRAEARRRQEETRS